MKKITFILVALISGTAFAQSTASGDATVNAEIVMPISVSNGTSLDFGRIIGNAVGGTVTIAHDNTRTADDNALLAPSTTEAAATFDITAGEDEAYNIVIPGIELSGSGDAMNVVFTNNIGSTSNGTGEVQDLIVGGTITVNENQAVGIYTGTATVTVSYQ